MILFTTHENCKFFNLRYLHSSLVSICTKLLLTDNIQYVISSEIYRRVFFFTII
uniref:Uncharacterized protein n=1 Tax=Lepeophtheirus salmonis TaxID=72036 RepID=A0A0K2TQY9_LEPSM